MDIENLNTIVKIAETIGFNSNIVNSEYAAFNKRTSNFSVDIVYRVKTDKENAVYVSSSSVNTDDLDSVKDFSEYVQKAIMLAYILNETKVNGA